MGGIFINFKKVLIVAIFLTAIISLGCVSAADADSLSDEDVISEAVTADVDTSTVDAVETEFNDISDSDSADLDDQADDSLNPKNGLKANDLGAGEAGTFTDLYNLIQNSNTVNLDKDIVYNSTTDGEGSVIDHGNHLLVTDYTAFYIIINKNLVINGNGHTINGKNLASLFRIDGSRTVTLNNLNIVNCTSQRTSYTSDTYYGGAINAGDDSSTININNCNFTNNVAEDRAGVLYSTGNAKITIKNSNFNNNRAPQGGVIYASSAVVSVVNSNFTSNSATGNGGVFYMSTNDLNVTNSTFKRNSANQGGIVYLNGARTRPANAMMESSIFERNSASTNGGVVYLNNQYANADIHYDVFLNNTANVGSVLAYASLNSRILTEDDWWGTNKWNKNFINSTDSIPLMPDRRFVLSLAQSGPESATLTLELEDGASPTGNLPLRDAIMSISNGGTITPNATQVPKSIKIDYDIIRDSTITATVDNQPLTLDVFFSKKNIETLTLAVDDVSFPDQPILRVTASVDGKYNVTIGTNTFEIDVLDGQYREQLSNFIEGSYSVVVSRVDDPLYNDKFAYDTFDVIPIKKGTYTDLQYQIDHAVGRTLDLSYDFAYDPEYDWDRFPEGVLFNIPADFYNFYFTINGNGHTISGSDAYRIFFMTEDTALKLNNLTLCHGLSEEGSAVFIGAGGMLQANNVSFISNKATYNGGAIAAIGASVLINSTFTDNSAKFKGGAIYTEVASDVDGCTFDGNDIYGHSTNDGATLNEPPTDGENGGAALYSLGTLKVRDSIFKNNNPSYADGDMVYGALTAFQDVLLSNVNFTNNKGRWGGAVGAYGGNGALQVRNCRFEENEASKGGAIFIKIKYTVIDNCIFKSNSAIDGGAILHDADGLEGMDVSISNSLFDGNKATTYGSAILALSGFTYSNCKFINHIAPEASAVVDYGDGSEADADGNYYDSAIEKCIFENNSANAFGAVYFSGSKSLTVVETDFINNVAAQSGGAIWFRGSKLIVDKSNFKANKATDGALALYGDATITDSVFEENIGAPKTFNIFYTDDVNLILHGNTFKTIIPTIATDKTQYVYDEDILVSGNFDWGVEEYVILLPVTATNMLYTHYVLNFEAGDFAFTIAEALSPGTYTLNIAGFTDEYENSYVVGSNAAAFTVGKMTTNLESEDITVYATVAKNMTFTLKDANGNVLAGKEIDVAFNGETRKVTTDENGSIQVEVNMTNKGTYSISASFDGDGDYESAFASFNVIVKAKSTKLFVSDVSYSLSSNKYLIATLKSGDAPLANKIVTFQVNGKTYTGRTNADGLVKVAVALTAKKTYSVVATFSGDNSYGTAVASYKLKVTS